MNLAKFITSFVGGDNESTLGSTISEVINDSFYSLCFYDPCFCSYYSVITINIVYLLDIFFHVMGKQSTVKQVFFEGQMARIDGLL